jgi:hypothetical protein
MTTADAIPAELIQRWRAGERVPLWDALCEASATGEPVEEWVNARTSHVMWTLFVGGVPVAACYLFGDRYAWRLFTPRYGDTVRGIPTLPTLAAAKATARTAAVASLRGEA